MNKNLGTVDRVLRTTAAVIVGVLLLTGILSGVVATVLGLVAILLLLTSAISWCPLYALLKFSTLRKKAQSPGA